MTSHNTALKWPVASEADRSVRHNRPGHSDLTCQFLKGGSVKMEESIEHLQMGLFACSLWIAH